jgi:hypothetical protein
MIVPVICDVIASLGCIDVVFLHLANDLFIGLNHVLANDDPSGFIFFSIQLIPFAISNLRYCKSCLGIHIQNTFQYFFRIYRKIFWSLELTGHYFFIQFVCIWILKGKISA